MINKGRKAYKRNKSSPHGWSYYCGPIHSAYSFSSGRTVIQGFSDSDTLYQAGSSSIIPPRGKTTWDTVNFPSEEGSRPTGLLKEIPKNTRKVESTLVASGVHSIVVLTRTRKRMVVLKEDIRSSASKASEQSPEVVELLRQRIFVSHPKLSRNCPIKVVAWIRISSYSES